MQGVGSASVTFCKWPCFAGGASQALKNSEPEMTSGESNQGVRASKLLGGLCGNALCLLRPAPARASVGPQAAWGARQFGGSG